VFFIPFNNVRDREELIEGLEYQLYEDAYSVIQAAMQGLRDFRDDHFKLVESESMKECKQDYRGLFDSFSLFAEAHIKAEPEAKVSSKEITAAYTQFCAEQSYQTLDSNIWSQLLKQRFGCSSCTRVNKENGKRERAYKGICLCDIEENSSWIVTRHMESEAW
jgi:phage/plasmid-associated DNA primase